MRTTIAAAIALLAGTPALAHRLDEYLQGTILSVEKDAVQGQITLTPGVAVFPILLADFDTDGDGAISETEQRAYAGRVLHDVSLRIDGRYLQPRLLSIQFPAIGEMKEGRGEIRLEFTADLPDGGPYRRLVLENHHQSRIAAYQVNCLVPRDPDIRITAQNRNYQQSFYQLDYAQPGVRSAAMPFAWWPGDGGWLGAVALLLLARFALLWRQRAREVSSLLSRPPTPSSAFSSTCTNHRR